MKLKLLVNYLSGECSKMEEEVVERWVQADPKNKDFLKYLRKIWEVEPDNKISVNEKYAWDKFKQEVIDEDDKNKSKHLSSPPSSNKKIDARYIYLHIAAAAALAFIVFLFISNSNFGSNESAKEQFTVQEIVTEKGERKRVKLTDGTKVILNSDSRLKVPSKFVGDSREVQLTGEAHFEVTHQSGNKPFIVISGHSFTKVLGTKFVVSAYSEDENVLVAVTEGKVRIGIKDQFHNKKINSGDVAKKGDLGVLNNGGSTKILKPDNIEDYVSWTTGKLIFNNTSFEELKPRIERWYDISIVVNDPTIYSRRLTAEFDNEPLNEVLKVMAHSMDMEFYKENDKITFFDDK